MEVERAVIQDTGSHPHAAAVQLECIDGIRPQKFREQFVGRNRPLHIRAFAKDWPALKAWSFEYIASLSPEMEVGVMAGDLHNDETHFEMQTLGRYMKGITSDDANTSYLAVFHLFKKFPKLKRDIDFSLISETMPFNYPMGWIGPPGTVSGYHLDMVENLVAQICGRKRFHLIGPDDDKNMYPGPKYEYLTVISQVDARKYDAERFPLFGDAKAFTVTLDPGDGLYIPRGWWHYAESLEPSITVNNFSYSWWGAIRDMPLGMIKMALHRLGLYRRENCSCHEFRDGRRIAR